MANIFVRGSPVTIFEDVSGSVMGHDRYHAMCLQIYSETKEWQQNDQGTNPSIVIWDDSISEISEHDHKVNHDLKRGFGGTVPVVIASYSTTKNVKGNIIIITDGQVSKQRVEQCTIAMRDWEYASVTVFTIVTGFNTLTAYDDSVGLPFARNCPYHATTVLYDGTMKYHSVTHEEFAVLEKLDEISSHGQFHEMKDAITNAIIQQTIGSQETEKSRGLKVKLLALKQRLVMQSTAIASELDPLQELEKSILENDRDNALIHLQTILTPKVGAEEAVDAYRLLDKLVSYCTGGLAGGSLSVSQVREDTKLSRAPLTEAVALTSITCSSSSFKEEPFFVDPISLSEDEQIITIGISSAGGHLFQDLPSGLVSSIMASPLILLTMPELCQKLKTMLLPPISLTSKIELQTRDFGKEKCVSTRKSVYGPCLVFAINYAGVNMNQVKATTQGIYTLLSGDVAKVCGDSTQWLYVISQLIGELGFLCKFKANVTDQLRFRYVKTKASISLCGHAEKPQMKVPYHVALWSVLNCPFLFQSPKNDLFRTFSGTVARHLLGMYAVYTNLEGCVWADHVIAHCERLEITFLMFTEYKKDPTRFRSFQNALYKPGIFLDGQFLPVDPSIEEIVVSESQLQRAQDEFCPIPTASSLASQYFLVTMANRMNIYFSDVQLSITEFIDSPLVPAPPISYPYYNNTTDYVGPVTIHPLTRRPVYDNGNWETRATALLTLHPYTASGNRPLSLFSRFADYVAANNSYPELNSFIHFVYKKDCLAKNTSLPCPIVRCCKEVIEKFAAVNGNDTAAQYLEKHNESRCFAKRNTLEKK